MEIRNARLWLKRKICISILSVYIGKSSLTEGDVIQDESQRQLLAEHSLQCCKHSEQYRNVTTPCCAKNRPSESSCVTSPLSTTFTLYRSW